MRYINLLFVLIGNLCVVQAQVCPGTPGQITWEMWEGLEDDVLEELFVMPNYPSHPVTQQIRYRLQSPINYKNDIGGRMRGFITVPTTTTVTFNLTGDDVGKFYLSTDADPANKILVAEHENWTNVSEHDKYPTQTSSPITLVAGVDYFFEVVYVERSGGDHSTVYWKTDLVDPDNWNIVTFQYLKDIACDESTCQPLGAPCDDGNPNTINDMEDGYCNCLGVATASNTCIGERGKVKVYRYDNIPGSHLSDLYDDVDYPAMPDYSMNLSEMGYNKENVIDDMGQLLQGYIKAPMTGTYEFVLTADGRSTFNLSTDSDPVNMAAMELYVNGSTSATQYDKYSTQISAPVTLQAGEYYYYEVNHKESGGNEFFTVFWKTPFTAANQWKRIPDIYLYDYNCTLACIPPGVTCDDGDIFTNDDAYNDNCECAGIPCSGADCDDPLASYVPFEKCNVSNLIGNDSQNSWLSCTETAIPNPNRGQGHWIMYDLGERHFVLNSHVWNYNVSDSTHLGFTDVGVDYSLDGNTWTVLDDYLWPLASGEIGYGGFVGPDFMGAEARYVLVSTNDKLGCKGLSKVVFNAVLCPVQGTACDDDDQDTFDDKYDGNCECKGESLLENDCALPTLLLGDSTLTNQKYTAIETVTSISEIDASKKVSFVGGDYIILDVGFETQIEANFIASIDSCETTAGRLVLNSLLAKIKDRIDKLEEDKKAVFQVVPSKDNKTVEVTYYLPEGGDANVTVNGSTKSANHVLADHTYKNKGLYKKIFPKDKLSSGSYTVKLVSKTYTDEKRLVIE